MRIGFDHDRDGCPHTRGGEPIQAEPGIKFGVVVPTRVGVNRDGGGYLHYADKLSPHAWG